MTIPTYQGWRNTPPHLWTSGTLADLDLPRVPGGPVRALVKGRNPYGRKATMEVYDVRESLPSPATAAQLEAARKRATRPRECADCGAHPDRPPLETYDGTHLCLACTHIARIRRAQAEATAGWAGAVDWARERLADTNTVLVQLVEILRPPAPSGRRNPAPVALRVGAVYTTGGTLVDATIRLAGPRVNAVPADAVDPASVEEPVRKALTAETIITWGGGDLYPLRRLYGVGKPGGWYAGNPNAMDWRTRLWRGDVDPDTLQLRTPLHPGRADRMLLLLRRMAETEIKR